jgi:glycosyltransferase involved in cell wall biosynthesis
VFTGRQDKALIPDFLAASQACLVHLRDTELFSTVIPSKIFEAAGMARPIIIGVRGQAMDIVLEAGAGLAMAPESVDDLLAALEILVADPARARSMGEAGRAHVCAHYERNRLADTYLALLEETAKG